MAQQPISLQSPVGDGDDTSFGDFIEDKGAENPYDMTAYSLLREKIIDVLDSLPNANEMSSLFVWIKRRIQSHPRRSWSAVQVTREEFVR